jgi:hypothetical protein
MRQYVRLTKVSAVPNPLCPTPLAENYIQGTDNGDVSLPLDYVAEGYLLGEVKVGLSLRMDRRIRNGIPVDGLFESTTILDRTICTLDNNIQYITTRNSIYRLEPIEAPKEV